MDVVPLGKFTIRYGNPAKGLIAKKDWNAGFDQLTACLELRVALAAGYEKL
ncbi:MAG TPA: hypothetical protein VMX38_21840 [Verrucomicrobiae bacterium]|jgi:hypothetical protein|nr:hypothetical protein [Verrucomicrobiae bacterium]